MVRGTIECIVASLPHSEITFLCHHYDTDKDTFARMVSEDSRIRMMKHPWYRESNSRAVTIAHSGVRFLFSLVDCAMLRAATKLGMKSGNPFYVCDLVLDLNTMLPRSSL